MECQKKLNGEDLKDLKIVDDTDHDDEVDMDQDEQFDIEKTEKRKGGNGLPIAPKG